MLILAGLFFIGLGIYVRQAPHDWGDDEIMRYDQRTRKSTLHPAIGGPLAIVMGIGCIVLGAYTAIQDNNSARATQQAIEISSELGGRFSRIVPTLSARAESQPGMIMTLTAGERESAGIPEEVMVYYGWCTVSAPISPFYIVIQNYNGQDYQYGFPSSIYGGCGGRPTDMSFYMEGRSPEWLAIRGGSFDYNALMTATAYAPTANALSTEWAQTAAARPTNTPIATRTATPAGG